LLTTNLKLVLRSSMKKARWPIGASCKSIGEIQT
jgi:hypothetical protein